MKVKIDAERCQGHGMCNMVCAQVFQHDEEGYGYVVPEFETVPESLVDVARLAEAQCPERAIVIIE